jgi:signal transduction histidine kinase
VHLFNATTLDAERAIMTSTSAAPAGADEQFIVNFAQQLRDPLVPIRNAAALLKREAPDPITNHRIADIIERHTNDLHRLIGDLVDVSRLQGGTLALARARAPLSGLVEQALESAGELVNERGHTLSVSLAAQPTFLYMDTDRLKLALHHIITNACRYTERQGYIHIRAQRDGAVAVITVADTGDGIPATELEAIFGLFVQGGNRRRAEPGLGVGLYLARHLIEAHGGTVNAQRASVGRGSVFTVRLPCEAATAPLP